MGRILALDYGTKRIGVAVSDETKKIALPKPYILASHKNEILKFITDHDIDRVLIGLPKNLKGEEGLTARAVRNFASWLREETRLPIEFLDERFTTREAQQKLSGLGLSGKGRKSLIDSMSAQILLELYLRKKLRN